MFNHSKTAYIPILVLLAVILVGTGCIPAATVIAPTNTAQPVVQAVEETTAPSPTATSTTVPTAQATATEASTATEVATATAEATATIAVAVEAATNNTPTPTAEGQLEQGLSAW